MARIHDAASRDHGALALVDLQAEVLLACEEEVPDVQARLKADDVAAEQAFEDRVPHLLRQDFPVLRRGPGHMEEELDDSVGHLLPQHSGHEVELIVVDEHEGRT